MSSTTPAMLVETSQGKIALLDSKGDGWPVFFIHGNSACCTVWQQQFTSDLAKKYRFIAIDLPGHGESEPPKEREKIYTYQGYASVVDEVMRKVNLDKPPVVVGWSLGAHIAFALLGKLRPQLAGLLITGASPIAMDSRGRLELTGSFNSIPERQELLKKEQLDEAEARKFVATSGFNHENAPFMVNAALKTDGKARSMIIQNRDEGNGCFDSKTLVANSDTPLCIVEGKNDPLIRQTYLEQLTYKNLFERKIFWIEQANHAPFWDQPEEFNTILSRFLAAVAK